MMRKQNVLLLVLVVLAKIAFCQDWKYLQNETYTYDEVNEAYQELAKKFPDVVTVNVLPMGIPRAVEKEGAAGEKNMPRMGKRMEQRLATSDVGQPIYHIVLDKKSGEGQAKEKATLLINNAIHPGEPCGVDASVKLAYDLLNDKALQNLLNEVRVVIIPIYNVGGALNRGQSRVNQPGPVEYGFRGNAQNLDLNRDFIKNDSKNAMTFARIYHRYKPEVFIDAHTTNGYDYQYGMGLLATHPDKLSPNLANYMTDKMMPFLFSDMKEKGKEITPYVFGKGKIPEDGLKDYLETPRYSSGYTTLFNTIGFITEAHKYKPYKERVEYTYAFYITMLQWMSAHAQEMVALKQEADQQVQTQSQFAISWAEDTVNNVPRTFKGYEAEYKTSEITGQQQLVYNRERPFTKQIPYYNHFTTTTMVQKPAYYVVPQAWDEVIERLRLNRVQMRMLMKDTVMDVDMYYIDQYETVKSPYEGHYLHYNTQVHSEKQAIQFRKGDVLIQVNQASNRYIVETLEPHGVDSYFNWNFFDGILQQKEWFSAFAFEETAKEVLNNDPKLKADFEQKKQEDEVFAKDHFAQLYYIYKRSPYLEKSYMRYPVGRINGK